MLPPVRLNAAPVGVKLKVFRFSSLFLVVKKGKIRVALVSVHILRTDADHRAGEGAPPAAGLDIVITEEVVGGLNHAQGLPAVVRLVIN